jgi:diguanylate cyclase (GGDEF)-like protein
MVRVGGDVNLGDDLRIVAELGGGAHATVYRVLRDGKEYALKVAHHREGGLRPGPSGFRREAAQLARVAHWGVPRVYDVGEVDGRPYLVMELLDGTPLADLLAQRPLDEPACTRLGLELAAALAAVHRVGLVHRDISPTNVMVSTDGSARLIDFGLAVRGRGGGDTDGVAGTFAYCAPEQAGMLRRAIDGRTDLYSLGVVLFEAATGELPFISDDIGELVRLHATAEIPDVRARNPAISPGYGDVISRLLAKDPDDRYQRADELWHDLARLPATNSGVVPDPAVFVQATEALVGRERERAVLAERWAGARRGAGGIVLVKGATGTGKTTLAKTVARTARAAGALVLSGKCDPDDRIPLAAIRAAIDQYVRSFDGLPKSERDAAMVRTRAAAGAGAALLAPLSPALAVLLDAPVLADEDRSGQIAVAVAEFLIRLADRAAGLLLHLDDVQWADLMTRQIIRRLAADLATAPVLVVATARDGTDHENAVAAFLAAACDGRSQEITLGPLDDDQVAELVSAHLRGAHVGPDLVTQLAARGGGNPFATLEYLHALVDAGALSPHWGTWQLDGDLLQALRLPEDVLDLVLARIDDLGGEARRLLVIAAAIGSRFRPSLMSEAAAVDVAEALSVVRDAVEQRLVEAAGPVTLDGEVGFVHDRIREALLHGHSEADLRQVHQRIAEVLDRRPITGPGHVYALAGLFAAGEIHRTPERMFQAGFTAGRLALAENAVASAVSFLESAAAAAAVSGTVPNSEFREAMGEAYLRTGRLEAAERELVLALDAESDPLRRAALWRTLSLAHRGNWDIAAAVDACRQGLAEIGHPVPRNPLALTVEMGRTLLLTAVTGGLGWGRLRAGRTPAATVERVRLRAALNLAAAHSCGVGLMNSQLPFFNIQAGWPASRLGPSTEYVQALIGLGMSLSGLRLLRRADMVFEQARSIATDRLGDPKLAAEVSAMSGLSRMVGGADEGQTWFERTEEQRRWLDTGLYLNGTLVRSQHLLDRGYAREALSWYEHGMSAVAAAELPAGLVHGTVATMARALLGDATGASASLEEQRRNGPDEPARLVSVALAALQCAYEQGELGDRFEEAIADFMRLRVKTSSLYSVHRAFFVYQALGRLTLCQQAAAGDPEALPERLAAATRAVKLLGRAADNRLLHAHHHVARASLIHLHGDPDKALDALARAEPAVHRLDAPAIIFEIARIRARALRSVGAEPEARRQATTALRLAVDHGWSYRARWVRTEFGLTEPSHALSTRQAAPDLVNDRQGRRLAVLQQVSLAAASVLDPQELARVALDQTLTILGAERALLFLAESGESWHAALGRDSSGRDLTEFGGYSSTLLDRVTAERTAVVMTGTDEGTALGSRSAVAYGLRSIMAAPLEIDGRLLGAIYLDSRVAKGVFTHDDVGILLAIAHQVAASLETARAAQLDTAVQIAHRQRDLAETLRASMTELTGMHDPSQVIGRLLEMVSTAASADRARILLLDGETLTVMTADGLGASRPVGHSRPLFEMGEPAAGVSTTTPPPEQLTDLLGPVGCWMAVPLAVRSHDSGVLIAGSITRDAFTDAELEIVGALTRQGAAAHDNAVLFSDVQRLATTDGLTGIANRRQFTESAQQQLSTAQRNHRPLSALMVDIDHFKRVNDTHGHSTGDEVIKTVARVLATHLRNHDIVGRLGGEEFAAIMPEMHGDPVEAAERIRAAVEAATSPGSHGPVSVTISAGLAELKPDDTLDTLLSRADEALYRAKRQGRNRVHAG